jgi:hypothetical protein
MMKHLGKLLAVVALSLPALVLAADMPAINVTNTPGGSQYSLSLQL